MDERGGAGAEGKVPESGAGEAAAEGKARASEPDGAKPSGTKRKGPGKARRGSGRNVPAGTDHEEVEWQFDADDLGPVEVWLVETPIDFGLDVGEGSADELVDGYYDTKDWRLYRAGYALRVREKGDGAEATMKSLASGEGGLRRRREISEPLKDGGIGSLRSSKGLVGERLRTLIGEREVRRLFQVRTRRKTFPLSVAGVAGDADGTTDGSGVEVVQDAVGEVREPSGARGASVGEVVLDTSEISLGEGDEPAGLTRVEVEVDAGSALDLGVRRLVQEMEDELGLRRARISKYEAGIFATGLSPEGQEDLGPTAIDASLSLGEIAFAVLRRQFAVMRAHEPGTRLGEDAEELHDMRVATRRLRAAMKLFEDVLPERSRWLREELRFFAGAMGEVRDLDVQIEEVAGLGDGDEEVDEALSAVVAGLKRRRETTRKRLLEALDSDRYARFESSFAEMLRRGPEAADVVSANDSSEHGTGEPALEAAPGILGRRYRKWRKAAGRLDEGSRPEEYHDLRKKGKRLRYALEFFSGVYGEEATDALVKPLKAVQDSLGRHQDVVVAAELLREIALSTPRLPKRAVFGMGLLAQRYHDEAAALRASFVDAEEYRALVGGKAWGGFEKVMEKERRAAGRPRKGSGKKKAG